jgi:hypothetical protein
MSSFAGYLTTGLFQPPHPHPPFSATPGCSEVIRWNVESVREYEKASRCIFSVNKIDFLLVIKRAQFI